MASSALAVSKNSCLIVGLACEDIIIVIPHFPKEDEKLRCNRRLKKRGGNAGSSATVMALLGGKNIEFMGPQASREKSTFVMKELGKHGISTQFCVFHSDSDMNQSYILLSEISGSRTIINYPAFKPLTCADFTSKISHDVLLSQLNLIHFEARWMNELFKILDYLEQFNMSVARDADKVLVSIEVEKERLLNDDKYIVSEEKESEAPGTSGTSEMKGKEYVVDELIYHADLVFFSKQLIVGRGYSSSDPIEFMRHVLRMYCNKCEMTRKRQHKSLTLIVPWGEKGAYGATLGQEDVDQVVGMKNLGVKARDLGIKQVVGKVEIMHTKAYPPKKVVDTIGAGDTFNGAYLYAMRKGMDTKSCMDFACQVAGFKVGTMGFESVKNFVYKKAQL